MRPQSGELTQSSKTEYATGVTSSVSKRHSVCPPMTTTEVERLMPVAYSVFDDWVNSPIWGRIAATWGAMTGRLRHKVATATSSFLGLFGK